MNESIQFVFFYIWKLVCHWFKTQKERKLFNMINSNKTENDWQHQTGWPQTWNTREILCTEKLSPDAVSAVQKCSKIHLSPGSGKAWRFGNLFLLCGHSVKDPRCILCL